MPNIAAANVPNYTAIALVVDRSGSMESIKGDTVGSIKQFIGDQKKLDGKATLRIVQFDDKYETVYKDVDIKKIDEKEFAEKYCPRGCTALLDAIGRIITELGQTIKEMKEKERPSKVVVAIITDGYENAT